MKLKSLIIIANETPKRFSNLEWIAHKEAKIRYVSKKSVRKGREITFEVLLGAHEIFTK